MPIVSSALNHKVIILAKLTEFFVNSVSDSKNISVTFKVLFPVTDDYGNTSYSKVLFARYSSDTLAKINWDNFISDKIDNIADTFEIDSQLKQYIQ